LSPLSAGTLQAIGKAKISAHSIQQAKVHEVTTGSIEVQLNPTQPISNLITPFENLQNKEYEIYIAYEQIRKNIKERINDTSISNKRKKCIISITERNSAVYTNPTPKVTKVLKTVQELKTEICKQNIYTT